jgi:hypothetical protein
MLTLLPAAAAAAVGAAAACCCCCSWCLKVLAFTADPAGTAPKQCISTNTQCNALTQLQATLMPMFLNCFETPKHD